MMLIGLVPLLILSLRLVNSQCNITYDTPNVVYSITTTEDDSGFLDSNTTLSTEDCTFSLTIPSGASYFELLYDNTHRLWYSSPEHTVRPGTYLSSPYSLELTPSGNLRFLDESSDIIWQTMTINQGTRPYVLTLEEGTGDILLMDSTGTLIWNLFCGEDYPNYFISTDVLSSTEALYQTRCQYKLDIGEQQLRLLYYRTIDYNNPPSDDDSYSIAWRSQSWDDNFAYTTPLEVTMDDNGTLRLMDDNSDTVWVATYKYHNFGVPPYITILDNDGILSVYDSEKTLIWDTDATSPRTSPDAPKLEYVIAFVLPIVVLLVLCCCMCVWAISTRHKKRYTVEDVLGVKKLQDDTGLIGTLEEHMLVGKMTQAQMILANDDLVTVLDMPTVAEEEEKEAEYDTRGRINSNTASDISTDMEESSPPQAAAGSKTPFSDDEAETEQLKKDVKTARLADIASGAVMNEIAPPIEIELAEVTKKKEGFAQRSLRKLTKIQTTEQYLQSSEHSFEWLSSGHIGRFKEIVSCFAPELWICALHIFASFAGYGMMIRWGVAVYGGEDNKWVPTNFTTTEMAYMFWLLVLYTITYHIGSAVTIARSYRYTLLEITNQHELTSDKMSEIRNIALMQFFDLRIINELGNSIVSGQRSKFFYEIFKMKYTAHAGPIGVLYLYYLMRVKDLELTWLCFFALLLQISIFLTRNILFDEDVFIDKASQKLPPSPQFLIRVTFRFVETVHRFIIFALLPMACGWEAIAFVIPIYIVGNSALYRGRILGTDPWNILFFIVTTPDMGLVARPREMESWLNDCLSHVLVPIVKLIQCIYVPHLLDYFFEIVPLDEQILFDFFCGRFIDSNIILIIIMFFFQWHEDFEIGTVANVFWIVAVVFCWLTFILFFVMRKLNLFDFQSSTHFNPLDLAKDHRWTYLERVVGLYTVELLDKCDRMGAQSTLMMMAAREGKVSIMEKLLRIGCEADKCDRYGDTPLHKGCVNGRREVLELLIKPRANGKILNVNKPNNFGWTPLHKAAYHGNRRCVSVLLAAGANPKAIMAENYTCIGTAMLFGDSEVSFQMVTEMLQYVQIQLSPNKVMNAIEYASANRAYGGSLIHSVDNERVEIANTLLDCDTQNINATDIQSETVLHKACKRGYHDLAKRLIFDHNVDIFMTSDSEMNAFHIAVYAQHPRIVNLLLKQRITISLPTLRFGNQVLCSAAVYGNLNIVKLMIRLGADINHRDGQGRTPLLLAAYKNHIHIIRVLLAVGAYVFIRDWKGRTVFDYELTPEVIDLLRVCCADTSTDYDPLDIMINEEDDDVALEDAIVQRSTLIEEQDVLNMKDVTSDYMEEPEPEPEPEPTPKM